MEKESTLPLYLLISVGILDLSLILAMLAGNILTICAVKFSKKLSAVLSNQFIFSLALSDIMVAITFPYHYAFFITETLSRISGLCIVRFVLTILACSSSICNLLGIAMDRYIAIVYPLHYSRYMTKKVAIIVIISSWILAIGISIVPIFWNKWNEEDQCTSLHKVLATEYVNCVIIPMFASVWIGMLLVYTRIWKEATGHAKRLKNSTNYRYGKNCNDSKSVQVKEKRSKSRYQLINCLSCMFIEKKIITIINNQETLNLSTLIENIFYF